MENKNNIFFIILDNFLAYSETGAVSVPCCMNVLQKELQRWIRFYWCQQNVSYSNDHQTSFDESVAMKKTFLSCFQNATLHIGFSIHFIQFNSACSFALYEVLAFSNLNAYLTFILVQIVSCYCCCSFSFIMYFIDCFNSLLKNADKNSNLFAHCENNKVIFKNDTCMEQCLITYCKFCVDFGKIRVI